MLDLSARQNKTTSAMVRIIDNDILPWLKELSPKRTYTQRTPYSLSFKVSDEEGLVVRISIRYMFNCGPIGVICGVRVSRRMQRKGVGLKIQEAAIKAIREAESSAVVMTITGVNVGQRRIAEKLNFIPVLEDITNSRSGNSISLFALKL